MEFKGEPFDTYFQLEAERHRFEVVLDQPRDFMGDAAAEESFYREQVDAYLKRLRELLR